MCLTIGFNFRFWYENPSVFKPSQLTELRQTSLARVLCDNGDDLQDITKNVFILQNEQTPSGFVKCNSDEIPRVNLLPWTECCRGKYNQPKHKSDLVNKGYGSCTYYLLRKGIERPGRLTLLAVLRQFLPACYPIPNGFPNKPGILIPTDRPGAFLRVYTTLNLRGRSIPVGPKKSLPWS